MRVSKITSSGLSNVAEGINNALTVLSGIDVQNERQSESYDVRDTRNEKVVYHTYTIDAAVARMSGSMPLRARESSRVEDFVRSRGFRCTINVLIILSSILLGMEADGWPGRLGWFWDATEHFFTAAFAIEMVLMIIVMKGAYFMNLWCVVDFIICWTSIMFAWVLPNISSLLLDTDGWSQVRIFRLLRLFRILRIMKAIPELRMVLEGIVKSMKAIGWVILLLFLVIYAFSVCCVHMIGKPDAGYPGFNASTVGIVDTVTMRNFNNYEYFGDMYRSMMSLFGLAMLVEWDAMRPIWEYQSYMIPVFLILIFVSSFAIVNVIIGVICESTNTSMEQLARKRQKRRQAEQMRKIQLMTDIVWKVDEDNDGEISLEEMKRAATDPTIMQELRLLCLPKGFTFEDFHTMLNLDGTSGLAKSEFVDGMHRLIFSTDFQKACVTQLGIGQVKVLTQKVGARLVNDQYHEFRRLRRQLRRLKASMMSEFKKTRSWRRKVKGSDASAECSEESVESEEDEDAAASESSASGGETPCRLSRELRAKKPLFEQVSTPRQRQSCASAVSIGFDDFGAKLPARQSIFDDFRPKPARHSCSSNEERNGNEAAVVSRFPAIDFEELSLPSPAAAAEPGGAACGARHEADLGIIVSEDNISINAAQRQSSSATCAPTLRREPEQAPIKRPGAADAKQVAEFPFINVKFNPATPRPICDGFPEEARPNLRPSCISRDSDDVWQV